MKIRRVYTGAPFTVNRQYTERTDGSWVILSAKDGFLRPSDVIPGPYETTFKRRASTKGSAWAMQADVDAMEVFISLGWNTGNRTDQLWRFTPIR